MERVILREFELPERARDFFYSDAYQGIIDLRFNPSTAYLYGISEAAAT